MGIPLLIQTKNTLEFEEILFSEKIRINSPDTIRIEPDGKTIRIDQIRELRSYLVNSGASFRLILLYSFEKATIETQNALLKILEESGGKFQFALQVDSIERVLPTIRSRCKSIFAKRSDHKKILSQEDTIRLMDYLDFGKNTVVTSTEEAEMLLIRIVESLQKHLYASESYSIDAIKKILKLLQLLRNNNLNPQLAVDQALILVGSIPDIE